MLLVWKMMGLIVYGKKLVIRRGLLHTHHMDAENLPVEASMEDKVLEILILLCKFVQRPPFGPKPPSENDCLQLWTSIFHIITDKLTLHTRGEKVLEASKVMKQMQSSEYGDISDSGRKVDCIFMYENIELSNIEFKKEDASERDLAIQNRKNVRLARCLQEAHAAIGVK
ncbi:hypothetical protein EDD21DRAFT_183002 [Dissophora ornata]|nr:hypothetical protein EDD21DRAFT_183002 [Dissophora ornata]